VLRAAAAWFICLSVTLATSSSLFAAIDLDAPKSMRAAYTEVAPELDGHLDDWAWLTATIVEDLHVVYPDEGATPTEFSRFYVSYDKDAIYLAAEFIDSEPGQITARTLRQGDYSEGDDGVLLILDPFNQGRSGYAFFLTVNAVRFQALYKNVTEENWNWDGIWHGATRRTADGWTAEIAVPLQTLSFDPENDTWGINFSRYIGRRTEEIGWVSHNRKLNPASSGKIIGLRGLQQGLGLDFVPALVVSDIKDHATGAKTSDVEPSLDVSYKPTPALTTTLTLNTDFTGTGADLRQVNLTRFDLFFPERRNFFLQDMDIFEFGRIGAEDGSTNDQASSESGRPFFSRRIGLSDQGETVDIDGGLKLTGRAGRFDYGFLGIRQGAFDALDAQDLYAARVSANVLEESAIGIIATHGDPVSNSDNSLIGADFRYLNTRFQSGRTLEGSVWYQQTQTPGLEDDDKAFGLSLSAPNSAGWNGELAYREIQNNFHPALGFVNQLGVRSLLIEGAYAWWLDSMAIRSIEAGVGGKRIETIEGELVNQEIIFDLLEIENHSGDNFGGRIHEVRENLAEAFEISEGVIIPAGDYQWTNYCVEANSGQHRAISFSGWACDGDFYDGSLRSVAPALTWRPNMHFVLAASYEVNQVELPYGSFTTRQSTLQADIAFTSTWYWENLVQYDNVSDNIGINSIMRWVPIAGRELLLVVNHEFADPLESRDFEAASSEILLKFYYTLRY
jgi:hypothetical protein